MIGLDTRDWRMERIDGNATAAQSLAHYRPTPDESGLTWTVDDIDRTYYLDTQGGE